MQRNSMCSSSNTHLEWCLESVLVNLSDEQHVLVVHSIPMTRSKILESCFWDRSASHSLRSVSYWAVPNQLAARLDAAGRSRKRVLEDAVTRVIRLGSSLPISALRSAHTAFMCCTVLCSAVPYGAVRHGTGAPLPHETIGSAPTRSLTWSRLARHSTGCCRHTGPDRIEANSTFVRVRVLYSYRVTRAHHIITATFRCRSCSHLSRLRVPLECTCALYCNCSVE